MAGRSSSSSSKAHRTTTTTSDFDYYHHHHASSTPSPSSSPKRPASPRSKKSKNKQHYHNNKSQLSSSSSSSDNNEQQQQRRRERRHHHHHRRHSSTANNSSVKDNNNHDNSDDDASHFMAITDGDCIGGGGGGDGGCSGNSSSTTANSCCCCSSVNCCNPYRSCSSSSSSSSCCVMPTCDDLCSSSSSCTTSTCCCCGSSSSSSSVFSWCCCCGPTMGCIRSKCISCLLLPFYIVRWILKQIFVHLLSGIIYYYYYNPRFDHLLMKYNLHGLRLTGRIIKRYRLNETHKQQQQLFYFDDSLSTTAASTTTAAMSVGSKKEQLLVTNMNISDGVTVDSSGRSISNKSKHGGKHSSSTTTKIQHYILAAYQYGDCEYLARFAVSKIFRESQIIIRILPEYPKSAILETKRIRDDPLKYVPNYQRLSILDSITATDNNNKKNNTTTTNLNGGVITSTTTTTPHNNIDISEWKNSNSIPMKLRDDSPPGMMNYGHLGSFLLSLVISFGIPAVILYIFECKVGLKVISNKSYIHWIIYISCGLLLQIISWIGAILHARYMHLTEIYVLLNSGQPLLEQSSKSIARYIKDGIKPTPLDIRFFINPYETNNPSICIAISHFIFYGIIKPIVWMICCIMFLVYIYVGGPYHLIAEKLIVLPKRKKLLERYAADCHNTPEGGETISGQVIEKTPTGYRVTYLLSGGHHKYEKFLPYSYSRIRLFRGYNMGTNNNNNNNNISSGNSVSSCHYHGTQYVNNEKSYEPIQVGSRLPLRILPSYPRSAIPEELVHRREELINGGSDMMIITNDCCCSSCTCSRKQSRKCIRWWTTLIFLLIFHAIAASVTIYLLKTISIGSGGGSSGTTSVNFYYLIIGLCEFGSCIIGFLVAIIQGQYEEKFLYFEGGKRIIFDRSNELNTNNNRDHHHHHQMLTRMTDEPIFAFNYITDSEHQWWMDEGELTDLTDDDDDDDDDNGEDDNDAESVRAASTTNSTTRSV